MLSAKNTLAFLGFSEMFTGIMLMVQPQLILSLLLIHSEVETLYLRFVGAFVFAVGTLYMLPLFDKSMGVLKYTIMSTSILRLNIFLFLLIMISFDFFHFSWIVVSLYDGVLACIQLYFLQRVTT